MRFGSPRAGVFLEGSDVHCKGFTLIEALITTLVLVTGLVAVAGAFSYSSLTTLRIVQETTALAMVSAKVEALKVADTLNPGSYSETLRVLPDGSIVLCEASAATYLRAWQISGESLKQITVTVYARPPGKNAPFRQLASVTALSGERF